MKKEELKKKEWSKPEVKSLSIKKETASGAGTGVENPQKRPLS